MRRCRNQSCGKFFNPPKPNYWWCSWECRQEHRATNDYRGYQRSRDQSYDRGYNDASRARVTIPKPIWKGLILFTHPDKYASEPSLQTLASECTIWLLANRPVEVTKR
jgi:hypothetical protein